MWRWGTGAIWVGSFWQWSSTPVQMTGLPTGDIVTIAAGNHHGMGRPAGLVDRGGNDDNVLCGLPGTGNDCRYCGCP